MADSAADLSLNVVLHMVWDTDLIAKASFQASIKMIEATVREARAKARSNVSEDRGPGPHPHRKTHGFRWKDSGQLAGKSVGSKGIQDSIAIKRGYVETANGKYQGMPEARLVVEPVIVPATSVKGVATGTRLVNYGYFLEMGFTPIIIKMDGTRERGEFTRYPFLAPAMYMATERFKNRMALMITQEIVKATKNKKKIIKKVDVGYGPGLTDTFKRISKIITDGSTVQEMKNLGDLDPSMQRGTP